MNLKPYFRGLSETERKAFAKRAGTSVNYINVRLIPKNRTPRKKLMRGLADASLGAVSYPEVLNRFYDDPEESAT